MHRPPTTPERAERRPLVWFIGYGTWMENHLALRRAGEVVK
jgi:hypothetical protein